MANRLPQLVPFDQHNQFLESNVHPSDWKNPTPASNYHLVIVGGGHCRVGNRRSGRRSGRSSSVD